MQNLCFLCRKCGGLKAEWWFREMFDLQELQGRDRKEEETSCVGKIAHSTFRADNRECDSQSTTFVTLFFFPEKCNEECRQPAFNNRKHMLF